MKHFCFYLMSLLVLSILTKSVFCQDRSDTSAIQISEGYLKDVSLKAEKLNEKLSGKMARTLSRSRKMQDKLKSKLYSIDSMAASNIFGLAEQRRRDFELQMQSPQKISHYIPFLDTLTTSLKFLDKNKELLANVKNAKTTVNETLNKVTDLEQQMEKAEHLKQFLKNQHQFLKQEMGSFGVTRQLKKLNKEAYYYSEQVKEYKSALSDKKRREQKAIELLSKTKMFQEFMKKNSMLASLFRLPADDPSDPDYLLSLTGLQTRVQVNQLIQQQISSGGPNALQQVQNNIQHAQNQLQQLKNRIEKLGGSGNGDDEIPDFRPNGQKVKSLFKRLEVGTNTQTQRSNGFFPASSDVGLSLGYKLNDKSVIGIGTSYRVGWGKSFRHIKITHEGLGLRSFIDYKLKKSIWITGGFEMNYRTAITYIDQLRNLDAWQQSGLIGVSKKLAIRTKFLKSTKVQLLWDFLSHRQLPRVQPLVFRIGYGFK